MMLTTALGEGIKGIIDAQVGSIGMENAIIVLGETEGSSSPVGDEPAKYNPNANNGMVYLENADIEKVKKAEGIVSVTGMESVSPEYITSDKTTEKYALSLTQALDGFNVKTIAGTLPLPTDDGYIIVSEKYVKVLGYENRDEIIGKKVSVFYKNVLGESLTREYLVKAVISNSIINNGSSYISPKEGAFIGNFQTKNTPFENKYVIAFALTKKGVSKTDLEKSKQSIVDLGYEAQTLDDQITLIKGVISGIQMGVGIFGAITVVASIFGIVNTLLMSVFERTREIGLMKAVGMKRSTVFTIFAIEAGTIGFLGGAGGVALAILAGNVLNKYLMGLNLLGFEGMVFFVYPVTQMATIVGVLTLVGLLAGVLPAMKASALDPIEALRHE
jgi:putative ABC transport system permease protein